MEGSQSSASRKRSFFEEDDDDSHSHKPPAAKRVRFPKGKKVKPGGEGASRNFAPEDRGPIDLTNPQLAAKERAKHRNQMTAELLTEESRGGFNDISAAEITYEDNENLVDDGIQIEPFNLDKERQEGYFDAQGNFVEYVHEKEIKDAWLDNVEVDTKLASRISIPLTEDDNPELSSDDIGKIKGRIAGSLHAGETVLQALRRLKGTSNNRKEKMSAETKHLFDQLTEDAAMLMEHGEYNVYHDQQEVFQREAEGYERLARARAGETDVIPVSTNSAGINGGSASSILNDTAAGPTNPYVPTEQVPADDADNYDMFAEDDEDTAARPSSEGNNPAPHDNGAVDADSQSDYVYDEASGYYYSSRLGYYFDPSTGLYCYAATGQWYSFNEEKGAYEEIPSKPEASNAT